MARFQIDVPSRRASLLLADADGLESGPGSRCCCAARRGKDGSQGRGRHRGVPRGSQHSPPWLGSVCPRLVCVHLPSSCSLSSSTGISQSPRCAVYTPVSVRALQTNGPNRCVYREKCSWWGMAHGTVEAGTLKVRTS